MAFLARTLLVALLASASAPALSQEVDAQRERERAQSQLESIQNEIRSRRDAVQRRQQRMSRVERELRDIETQVAARTQAIGESRTQLEANQQRITELEAEQNDLKVSLAEQAKLLEDQIESAYRSGGHDFIQILLNQQDPGRIERILTYYRYVNQARMVQIEALRATERELEAVEQRLASQRDSLQQRIREQEQQRDQLRQSQQEQEQIAAQLRDAQRTDEQALTSMLQNEQELTELLAALETVLAEQQIQLAGLRNLRGQLSWPVNASIRHAFGQQRSGQVVWKGVVLNANAEQPVQAIADGRVLFADWLRGFGLVMVIDHGEGYMSLYGYNQSLSRSVGEAVRRGDTIALTGQSGGQSRPGLYFEIRHQGNPVDPVTYIRR
ncbi:murein hydrolase activator EnvC family protein [Aliidiomarina maris]|uniref:Peptidase M23 n=1 Tax=Aliidiomarina maris TaxID=531312 RepID=A0A327X2J7_9GAMM|nr:peptidoglycan DD-metalloendopeptidase family protein [Aliidiomarina maris]RAJ99113.1 septal ring factor EnvC (AmiA/AmiB activator) [Aliidiomarina maris]RUO27729.1 peptidase M23 [Aliidiomarina maris]